MLLAEEFEELKNRKWDSVTGLWTQAVLKPTRRSQSNTDVDGWPLPKSARFPSREAHEQLVELLAFIPSCSDVASAKAESTIRKRQIWRGYWFRLLALALPDRRRSNSTFALRSLATRALAVRWSTDPVGETA